MSQPSRGKGLVLVVIGATLWGVGGTVSKMLFAQYSINVNWFVTVRMIIAGILLLTFTFFGKNRSQIFGVWRNKKAAARLVIFGLIGMLGVQYTYMASISYGNAAVATLLQNLSPVFIIIYLILRKLTFFTKRDLMIVVLSVMGCFLLLTNGAVTKLSVPPLAIFWGVLSGVSAAFYTVYAVNLLKKYDSIVIVGWAMIIGGFVLSFIHAPWQVDLYSIPAKAFLFLTLVILFGTMIAFWFFIESLKSLSPKETSLLGSLEPLSAVFTTVFWLKEPFGVFQWVGALFIFGMIILLALNKQPSINKSKMKASHKRA